MSQSDFFQFDATGWCPQVRQCPSPHHNPRPADCIAELLVIHNISLPPGEFGGPDIEQLFMGTLDCTRHASYDSLCGLRVSSHFLIRRDGEIVQFVSCLERAWHAGVSSFGERSGCNDFSIGIELEGSDFVAFTGAQYQQLANLSHALLQHYPVQAVRGHQHIAPGRKTDPGPYFDWDVYRLSLQSGARMPDFPPAAPGVGTDLG